ncbi:MAG: hypothetical protein L7U87_05415 [Chlamydiales bacterium]|nr:hypothetical protein [Chlamydiales bacterium]
MKVVCKIGEYNEIEEKIVTKAVQESINNPNIGCSGLEVGKRYTVYGIVFVENSPWYCIDADDYSNNIIPYAAELFEVVDDRLSSCWKLSVAKEYDGTIYSSLVFPEWADDPLYYQRLLDNYEEDVEIFKKYRILMDNEF